MKNLTKERPLAPPVAALAVLRRLVVAWLTSAGGLGLGGAVVAALATAHHARALLGLALVLAGWLHLLELAVQRALHPASSNRRAPAGWLLRCYCGFVLSQGLGLAAGCAVWVRTGHLRYLGPVLRPATLAAAKIHLVLSHF